MDVSTPEAAAEHFAERPEAELLYLARHASRYPPAVGAAAVAELQRRGLVPDAAAAPPPTPTVAAPAPEETWAQLLLPMLRSLFWPTRQSWAVPVLLNINFLVWLAMTLSGVSATVPTGHALVRWGSNVSTLTWPGQPWRLVTSLFVHGGITHLLLNMASLWLLGVLLEARTGGARLLAAYLASGVAASAATLWYHSGGINSTGASGAIFGLYGLLLVLLVSKKLVLDKWDRRGMLGLVSYLVLSNLISGLTGNIDNIAHLGGLLMGLLVAGPLVAASLKDTEQLID
ncbi:rhomboid family intramembrane serine protease [Hymenobacter sp. H14-R3]|uniref:rhomboid family intramembrane serine protease n=1 Tax=Hymenobacter sp. H14-R3 TaxID=3046308 RepID=UPI0024BA636D|nr:rhomboid family intramembrane serine protease [Hymenobacter sp. H14-R3]MDJ0366892.1 rhomboid family intramembrane serine protease [Hymenobacter sp. H14-R3]